MALTTRATKRSCYLGYIIQAIVNNLAPLLFVTFQNQYLISLEQIGRLSLVNFVTQLLVDVLAVRVVDRIGYRIPAVLAHFFCMIGLVGLGFFPPLFADPYTGLCAAVICYAIGGGLLEVIISPIVDSIPSPDKSASMSLLHSFYSWGQAGVVFVSTLFLKGIGIENWVWVPLVWAILPFVNMLLFFRLPLAKTLPDHERTPIRALVRSREFVIAFVMMVSAGATEMVLCQWASLFAEQGLGVTKVVGDLTGPGLFAIFMGCARMLYGFFGEKIRLRRALTGCSALCLLCYLVVVFSSSPFFSLAGCTLCGFGVGILWPGTLSLTSARFPQGGAAMFGILAVGGDLGCSMGPWVTGVVSHWAQHSPTLGAWGLSTPQMSLRCGIAVGLIFPILLLTSLFLLRRNVK